MTDRTPQLGFAPVYMKLLTLLKDVKSLASHFSSDFFVSEKWDGDHMVIIQCITCRCRNDRSWIMSRPSDAFCVRMDLSSVLSENCDTLRHLQWHAYLQLMLSWLYLPPDCDTTCATSLFCFVFGENWSRCPHSTLDILLIHFQHDKTMSPEKHETRLLGPFDSFKVIRRPSDSDVSHLHPSAEGISYHIYI